MKYSSFFLSLFSLIFPYPPVALLPSTEKATGDHQEAKQEWADLFNYGLIMEDSEKNGDLNQNHFRVFI